MEVKRIIENQRSLCICGLGNRVNTGVNNLARKTKEETFWKESSRTEINKMLEVHTKTSS